MGLVSSEPDSDLRGRNGDVPASGRDSEIVARRT